MPGPPNPGPAPHGPPEVPDYPDGTLLWVEWDDGIGLRHTVVEVYVLEEGSKLRLPAIPWGWVTRHQVLPFVGDDPEGVVR